MLEKLFKSPTVLARHRNAPLLEERTRYLDNLKALSASGDKWKSFEEDSKHLKALA